MIMHINLLSVPMYFMLWHKSEILVCKSATFEYVSSALLAMQDYNNHGTVSVILGTIHRAGHI